MGERLQRKLQRVASRRTAQWRDLLQPRRGQGADRSLAAALQHDPPPQQSWLPTASAGNGFSAIAAFRFRFAPPPGGDGKGRSEEHTSELQSLIRNSYAVFCLKKKKTQSLKRPTANIASPKARHTITRVRDHTM